MDIHRGLRIGAKQRLAESGVDLLGVHGVVLCKPQAVHLEGQPLPRLFRVLLSKKLHHLFLQLLIGNHVLDLHRADAHDAEDVLQRTDHLVEVVVRGVHRDKNSSGEAVDTEFALAAVQCDLHLLNQRFLKEIAVLSLDADLGILDQK